MKSLNVFAKVFYALGFVSILGSIILSLTQKEDPTWKVIAFLWMVSAFLTELRVSKLEDTK